MKIGTMNLTRFLVSDQGSTTVRFTIVLALAAVVCVTAYSSLQTTARPGF